MEVIPGVVNLGRECQAGGCFAAGKPRMQNVSRVGVSHA